jgi:hypothetical protein
MADQRDPQFNSDAQRTATSVGASVTASRGIQGTVANLATIKTALPQPPDTADEPQARRASVQASPVDLFRSVLKGIFALLTKKRFYRTIPT